MRLDFKCGAMPNPSPKITPGFLNKQFERQEGGGEPLCPKSLSVKVPNDVYQAIKQHPKGTAWMRRVLTEAARRELIVPAPPDETTAS